MTIEQSEKRTKIIRLARELKNQKAISEEAFYEIFDILHDDNN